VCRYVERNAARASLVRRAENWRWSSLWRWRNGNQPAHQDPPLVISRWPTAAVRTASADGSGRPRHWLRTVNTPLNKRELEALGRASDKCRPYGSERWSDRLIKRFDLESTTRQPGRPRKTE